MLDDLRGLDRQQRSAVTASWLGWTLDAFDFFILVFVFKDVAKEFHTDVVTVSWALFLTLAARPIGALIFGLAADKYGRRPTLMVDVLLFSVLEFASAFAPNLVVFMILRVLFGVAMGGEWGVGSSLTMETIPAKARGVVSGILQAGYPSGYLIASVVFGLLYVHIGWRGMFMVGAAPALLVLYIRSHVDESPVFIAKERKTVQRGIVEVLRANAPRFLFAIAIMTCFNFFSHGTQDMYPTFLREQKHYDPHTVSFITIVFNVGAIVGGITFGTISQRIGRLRAIMIAALLALPAIPFWAYGSTPLILAAGGFLMQFAVQGAWGVVPVYLNELSPDEVRGTFPGFAYQIGNLIAAVNGPLQSEIAKMSGGDYAFGLALVVGTVALTLTALAALGPEAHGIAFAGARPAGPEPAGTEPQPAE
jgi:MFS transporter, SHS family, lactate transporter